ncbi:MAG TPA: protein jag [Anaerolineae bacterium]|nr:protein jag [Anaerolineae bacterium]
MEARNGRRSVVASGKTVEDAINIGLQMLGLRRSDVEINVLSEGSRGVLGFGAENARVELIVKPPPPPPEEPPAPTAAPEPDTAAPEQVGRELLTDVLRLMGIRASVESKLGYELADEGQPPPLVLNITGPDLGILIGRRGETLRALQYLIRLMVSHRLKQWTNLVVDVENYLVRRRRALENLARRTAERAVQTGRTQALEPMPAYERRWVHIALRNHPLVTTQSIGEGDKRKVTVIPKK